ncbi:MAG: carboxypeptidase regulatory-like domain-containing protein [Bacteroidales bacterium]|nr:carboxypeptidase regulatory-like domain-containing protein [Bacteroidales bacterium]MBN2756288.1 carboxypeptidase regulatory-like domain-containing protein [Bacteroidales bacterium]
MKSRQENKLNMYLAVISYLNTKTEIINKLPKYVESFNALNTGINNIKTLADEQSLKKSGISKNNKEFKKQLAKLAADTSRKLITFAKFTNNNLLLDEINFTESKLKYANKNNIREYAQGIYNRAQSNITELEAYGISEETQTALLAGITTFIDSIPQPRIAKANIKQNTNQIVKEFINADTALANIDAAMEIIMLSELDLYKQYKTLRKIIPLGKGSYAVKGKITDNDTKQAIKNAKIVLKIKANGSPIETNGEIVKKSAKKGGFLIKSVPEGIYDVTISKNGYTETKTGIAVTTGELSYLNIELKAN